MATCAVENLFKIDAVRTREEITLDGVIDTSGRLPGRRVRVVERNLARPSVRNPDSAKARAQLSWYPALDLEASLRTLSDFLLDEAQ